MLQIDLRLPLAFDIFSLKPSEKDDSKLEQHKPSQDLSPPLSFQLALQPESYLPF